MGEHNKVHAWVGVVALAAAIGCLGLAGRVPAQRRGAAGAFTEAFDLVHGAFDEHPGPDVVVHASPGFDPARPLELMIFLHGWNGCANVLARSGRVSCAEGVRGERVRTGWGLAARFDEAHTGALLVVPQLAYWTRSGSPGRLAEPQGLEALLSETLVALRPRLGDKTLADVQAMSLVAHSAGFESAAAVLSQSSLADRVREVALLDALYASREVFTRWVRDRSAYGGRRRLVVLHTDARTTRRESALLFDELSGALGAHVVARDPRGALPAALRAHSVVVARSRVGHGAIPAAYLAELARAFHGRHP